MQVVSLLRGVFLGLFVVGFVAARGQVKPYLDRPITMHVTNVAVGDVFKSITSQAGVVFSYSQPFNDQQKVSLNCDKKGLRVVLDELLPSLDCSYVLKDKYIIIKNEKVVKPALNVISGYLYNVLDSTSIAEASVYLKQTKHSTVTNNEGYFNLAFSSKASDITVWFAKEDYRDTSVVVYNKTDQALYLYLFPTHLPSDTATLEASTVIGNDVVAVNTDSLVVPRSVAKESSFWARFKASHPNIRNISDTLFNHSSVSLVPSVSTNKELSINTVNDFSLNVLIGQSKGVNYAELGLLLNIVNGNVRGGQVVGLGNIVSGNVKGGQASCGFNSVSGDVVGGQAAAIVNIDRGNVTGGLASGVVNYLRGDLKGGQVAGVVNVVDDDIIGGQVAGVVNVDKGNLKGVALAGVTNVHFKDVVGTQVAGVFNKGHYVLGSQVAGVCNSVDSIRGFQLAGVANLSRYNSGFQLTTVFNQARYLTGSQLALVNVVDSCDGVPIGLLSIVNKGYHKIELLSDEMGFATVGFRTGVASLHNILFAGMNYSQTDLYTYGYGLGSAIGLSKSSYLDLSATAQQVQKMGVSEINLNLINKLYVGFNYTIGKKFGVSVGPSFNVMISDVTDKSYSSSFDKLVPYTFYNKTNNETNVKIWVGGQLSVRLL